MLSVLGARPYVLSSPVATLARGDCRSTSTPPATFIGDYRSTPAPLTAPIGCVDAYDSIDPRLPLALGACLHVPSSPSPASTDDVGYAMSPPLAASTGGGGPGGRSSPSATASSTSAMYFTEQEIVGLRGLLTASGSSLPGASTSTSSVELLTEQEITRLRCLLAACSGSSPTSSAGSATDSSGIVRPPSTQSGTSPWILDTGASFHMTHDSSTLSSIRALDSPIHVLTADGTSLPFEC